MKDKLFDTKEKAELAISNFTTLLQHPGWQLLEEIVNANIQTLTDKILEGGEKEDMDRARNRLTAYKDIIGTPRTMIEDLQEAKPKADSPDPYDKPKTLTDTT